MPTRSLGTESALTRRQLFAAAASAGAALVVSRRPAAPWVPPAAGESLVLRWNAALLEAVRHSRMGPPMVARALAIVHSAMFDAWAAYDDMAVGTHYGEALRRPAGERSYAARAVAMSFAAYRAAADVFPGGVGGFDALMANLGLNPRDTARTVRYPAGVGNAVAAGIVADRHADGANQVGDVAGALSRDPYSDYTGYVATNRPMDVRAAFDRSRVADSGRWQPLRYVDRDGARVVQSFLAPQWIYVRPFAMARGDEFRSAIGPARPGEHGFEEQAIEVLEASAALTDEQKAIVEYWADGPHSETPPGHWNLLASDIARRAAGANDDARLAREVQLFFALNLALADAGICAWDAKRAYDSVRPITAVRYLFEGRGVWAWAGPGRGTVTIAGETWLPYQPRFSPTPPFAEYPSGHSMFSSAAAEILRLGTGSDDFGGRVTIPPGSSLIEPGRTPAGPVTLEWSTFTEAADQAGMSRRYGGIHFRQGDLDARLVGRRVASKAWAVAQAYIHGAGPG